jgi:uncharacterized protein
MKKLTCIVIIVMVAFTVLAGGNAERPYSVVMGSSSLGGTWYPTAARMAGVAMEYEGLIITVQSSGGGAENVRLMSQDQYQMGLVEPNIANYAYRAEKVFEGDKPHLNLTFVTNLYPNPFAAVVHKEGPIKTMHDYNPETNGGKKYGFAPGTPGSGDEFCWIEIFSVYGVTKDNIKWVPSSHNERVSSFKDRILDGVGYATAHPSGSIIEASALNPIRILEISGKERDEIIKRFPWYAPSVIPAEFYNGVEKDVQTIYLGGFVLANADVPADFIYKYLTAVFGKGLKSIHAISPATKDITLENALGGNESFSVPLHPGAERFFKEKGLIK